MKQFVACLSLVLSLCGSSALHAAPYVCLDMNVGEVCMEMLPEAAPNTVANFLRYVNDGRYDNSLVHRSIANFVVQGGGFRWYPDRNPTQPISTYAPIANELGLSNLRGTVAMARVGDDINSATSQWFVNLVNNTNLNTASGGYTVFARVVKGMNLIDAIGAASIVNMKPYEGWGSAFEHMPVLVPPGTSTIAYTQLVYVRTAYQTDRNPLLLPYQCSLTSPGDTLTEFCGSSVLLPVLVDGVLYEGTLNYVAGRSGLVFSVDTTQLRVIADTGQARATFAAGVLTIPSVRYGAAVYDNVRLDLTRTNPIEFTVRDFTAR